MTPEQFLERLNRLAAQDQPGLEALAGDLAQDARQAVRAAVRVWRGFDQAASHKAAAVLSLLEDLALVPLIEAGELQGVEERFWLLRTAVQSELGLRSRLVGLVNRLLDDRREPVRRDMGPVEERPPLPRVCDEAYLVMRRLLNSGEAPDQFEFNARAFLRLSQRQKDREILKARQSQVWTQLVEEVRE